MSLGRAGALGAALVLACGGAPGLSRFALALPERHTPSVLSSDVRDVLEGSLGSRPTRERVDRRLALIDAAPTALTPDEARALIASTLDWVAWLRAGGVPDWVEPVRSVGAEGDVLGAFLGELPRDAPASALDRITAAIRGTRSLVERADGGSEAIGAWRAAMIALHGTEDECGDDADEGALAAAIGAWRDARGGPLRAADDERNLLGAAVACHVATLDGGVRLSRDEGQPFARACWARGGSEDARCGPFGLGRGRGADGEATDDGAPRQSETTYDLEASWARSIDAIRDAEIVIVHVGTSSQAERIVVVRREGAWRTIAIELAWTR